MPRLKHRPGRPSRYRLTLRSPQWASVARQVRVRDGHRCRLCGSRVELEVHHLSYRDERGRSIVGREAEHLDKLITLCSRCHEKQHMKNTLAI